MDCGRCSLNFGRGRNYFFAGKRRSEVDEEIAFHLRTRGGGEYGARHITGRGAAAGGDCVWRAGAGARRVPRTAAGLDAGVAGPRREVRRCAGWRAIPMFTAVAVLTLATGHRREHNDLQPAGPGADAGASGEESGPIRRAELCRFAQQGHMDSHGRRHDRAYA